MSAPTPSARCPQLDVADRGEGVVDWFVPELFIEFMQSTSGDQRSTLGLGLPDRPILAIANDGDLTYQRYQGET
jgi:K+-sensing histidine kinase KdpD